MLLGDVKKCCKFLWSKIREIHIIDEKITGKPSNKCSCKKKKSDDLSASEDDSTISLSRYILQSLIAGLFFSLYVFVYHYYLVIDSEKSYIVVASIGSSIFLVFAAPGLEVSEARHVLWGHVVSTIIGVLIFILGSWVFPDLYFLVKCFAAVTLSMFAMTVLDIEHAPAAGSAVSLAIIEESDFAMLQMIGFIFIAALFLSIIHTLFYQTHTDDCEYNKDFICNIKKKCNLEKILPLLRFGWKGCKWKLKDLV